MLLGRTGSPRLICLRNSDTNSIAQTTMAFFGPLMRSTMALMCLRVRELQMLQTLLDAGSAARGWDEIGRET